VTGEYRYEEIREEPLTSQTLDIYHRFMNTLFTQ